VLNNAASEETLLVPAGTPTVDMAVTSMMVENVVGVAASLVEVVQEIPAGFEVQGTPTEQEGGAALAGASCTVAGQRVAGQLGRQEAGSAPVVIATQFRVAADAAATGSTATVLTAEPEMNV